MERRLVIAKVSLKHNLAIYIIASLALCIATPLLMGTNNLNQMQVNSVIEKYICLVGIVLLVPMLVPDINKDIYQLVKSKKEPIQLIKLQRIVHSLVFLMAIGLVFLYYMKQNHNQFDFVDTYIRYIANSIFLGSLGVATVSISGQLVVGYMIPLMYFAINVVGDDKWFLYWKIISEPGEGLMGKLVLIGTGMFLLGTWFFEENPRPQRRY